MLKPIANTYEGQMALINPAKPVRVYRNLHTGLWSVKQGVVRFHANCVFLKDAVFLVNEKVRQRVIVNRRKEVHAYVQGWLSSPKVIEGTEITYNPYTHERFKCRLGEIDSADIVCLKKLSGTKSPMCVFASGIQLTKQVAPHMLETVPVHLL